MSDIKSVVKDHLCIGCGLCTVDSEIRGMKFNSRNDCLTPENLNCGKNSLATQICPGKGYSIVSKGKALYGDGEHHPMLGYYHGLDCVHTNDSAILENASSGGAITQLLIFLLEKHFVDKVSVTQFYCDRQGVHTKTFLTDDTAEILKAQGSKYCPVDLSGLVAELAQFEGRVAIMATPCAIAGIRNIQESSPSAIKSDIVFTITNFCGGFKSFKNIKRLAEIHQMDYSRLKDFRFRGEGQPGSLRFTDKSGRTAYTPYPKYVGLNGYSKMHRCFVCVDATGELADFSCGDAWIPKFQNDSNPWSVVISRTPSAKKIVDMLRDENRWTTAAITEEEVIQSQRLNLDSKKTRQAARRFVYKILGKALPTFDGGFNPNRTSAFLEMKVILKHWLTLKAEQFGLYMPLYGRKKLKYTQK